MFHLSLPAALSIFAATSAVAVSSVAVALPSLQSQPLPTATPIASTTPSPAATQVAIGDPGAVPSGNRDLGNGVTMNDVSEGLTANVRSTGVTFVYVGPCAGSGAGAGAAITVRGNNGQSYASGSAGFCNNRRTFASIGMVWDVYTRNAYCSSPTGGVSAYRAEAFGQFSEWVSIPAEYMQCGNNQTPEGPPAPATAPVVPAQPEPSPSEITTVDPSLNQGSPSPSSTP